MPKKIRIFSFLPLALFVTSCNNKNPEPQIDYNADTVFINGNIYTVNPYYPWSSAMVIKNGKLVYVGNEKGAEPYKGERIDLKKQFVMPGIIDSHTHIAWGSEALCDKWDGFIKGNSKVEILNNIKAFITANPENKKYRFVMSAASLNKEKLYRSELDTICPNKPLAVIEMEQHSRWLNTLEMTEEHISEDMPDIVPGLSYCERDENGKINGRIYEWCGMANTYTDFSTDIYKTGLDRITDCWKKWGVVAAFDAGQPSNDKSIDTFFNVLINEEKEGKLPYYIEGCYYIYNPKQLENAISELKRYDKTYNSEHVRARTMKIMMDGTMNGRTAALNENYSDVASNGGTLLDVATLTKFIVDLNKENIDLHVHTVGDRAVSTVLDAVENAQKQLGSNYKIKVTCAHTEYVRDEDIGRFAKLGVGVNMTPAWSGGNCYRDFNQVLDILGSRAYQTYRAETMWNTGASISFSSDCISLQFLNAWNPYVGMETGITRETPDGQGSWGMPLPLKGEKLSVAQIIKGYTINGAIMMNLDDKIGSLEVGKDASFITFSKSLFDLEEKEISKVLPDSFYIRGKLVK